MSRTWPAIEVRFTRAEPALLRALHDRVSAALDGLQATAIQEHDEARWTVFFTGPEERDEAAPVLLEAAPGGVALAAVDVPDEDWARRSQESLGPVRVGRLVISPPWSSGGSLPAAGDDLLITILPSMGFGTGHHPTTRLCLSLLQERDPAGLRVLDLGTGSGVLAIAARRLGAASVLGVDDDEDAVGSARENLSLNAVTDGVELRCADFRRMPDLAGDVVIANLTGALLLAQAAALAAMVAPGGSLIVSGLTAEEEPAVGAAFGQLSPVARLGEAEWVALRFDRRLS
ncbi:MAG TPA: 50S ribosomal protein L11 methyltransferase [Vicinamibacterales bacterium]|nr:50S ribosomal protein L11 methyltransferase [Vicinamibacterales bacterium]